MYVGINMTVITITSAHAGIMIDGVIVAAGANTVTNGSHTFSAPLFVNDTGITYKCTGWSSGTGDFAATGTAITVTVTVSQDGGLTWTWKQVYGVQANYAAAGVSSNVGICPVCGNDLYDAGATKPNTNQDQDHADLEDELGVTVSDTAPVSSGKRVIGKICGYDFSMLPGVSVAA